MSGDRTSVDVGDMMTGEEALVATANLLYQRMRADDRLVRYFRFVDIPGLASCLRRFLASAFAGAEWPALEVSEDLVSHTYDGFVEVLMECLQRNIPLGADIMTTGMDVLIAEKLEDERVLHFYSHLGDMAVELEVIDEEAPSDDPSADVKGGGVGGSEEGGVALTGSGFLDVPSDAVLSSLGASADADQEIVVQSFGDLTMEPDLIQAVQQSWRLLLSSSHSQEAAGEAIFIALFDAAPSLQALFTSPRAVHAMRFIGEMRRLIQTLEEPNKLKVMVETLGFGHLHWEVTVPRVVLFREAIIDILAVELGDMFSLVAKQGWVTFLNYVGGAIIHIKAHYSVRINILLDSWAMANDRHSNEVAAEDMTSGSVPSAEESNAKKGRWRNAMGKNRAAATEASGAGPSSGGGSSSASVPTTYPEMFKFNSAVMGFGDRKWLEEVLACFHNIVTNVSNSARLQEECDVLSLRISKCTASAVNFNEYKSCMLASLRSLLPQNWSQNHEVAWCWLWENVERLLQRNLGQPQRWEAALSSFFGMLDDSSRYELRASVYSSFFVKAPKGQEFFKQSNTYLHFIADRVLKMTVDIFQDPVQMVDDISALGLRHVGYGVPTEIIAPFVSCWVDVARRYTQDDLSIESFRWSLGLISKILARTIVEGSTIVMKAVNANDARQYQKSIACAPRGERASWMLVVQVGTQSISPLSWSLQSGKLAAAQAMIEDLLTIRADRDRYYYGADELFARHPDIVMSLRDQAPGLLPVLFDGLLWRSRVVEGGLRRVNYYIKHLIIDKEGHFNQSLQWVVESKDARIVCHSVIALLSDIVWSRVTSSRFLLSKTWLMVTLCIFTCGQGVLEHLHDGAGGRKANGTPEREAIFACRIFIYFFCMTQLLYQNASKILIAVKKKDFVTVLWFSFVPRHLLDWQEMASLLLTFVLLGMLVMEPIVYCLRDGMVGDHYFTEVCGASEDVIFPYTLLSMAGMFLYYSLLFDLVVFSNRISAYALVCCGMLSELALFLFLLFALILAFSSCLSVLGSKLDTFSGIAPAIVALIEVTLNMYSDYGHEALKLEPVVFVLVGIFAISAIVFLLNLLVAQLTCAYDVVYKDMIGNARLTRIRVIVEFMPKVPKKTWAGFVRSLQLDKPLEFNQGDVGLPGGIQVSEVGNLNPTTVDSIRRFGGSTSVTNLWPEEELLDEDERFDRMEKLVQKASQMVRKSKNNRGGGGGGSTLQSGTQQSGSHTGSQVTGSSAGSE
mmetsp:Transcript_32664/g.87685  ORF Transcript_32664/g.87685 Transcript_32664/m.87685 type:complete len:1245 (-) Transcript_32664:602-4336(-)